MAKGGKLKAKEVKDFLNASYEEKPPNNLDGYILDKSLSTATAKVYYNPQTNHAVVAHRGTKGTLDWGNNLAYAVGAYEFTNRYKQGKSVQTKAEKKYGKQNISTLGHSQGSILARKLGTDTKEVINVNPAYTGEKPTRNEYNIRSSTDVVSGLYAPVAKTREFLYPGYSQKHDITIPSHSATDVLGEHSYNILDRLGEKEIGVGAGNKISPNYIMYKGGKRYSRLGYSGEDIDWIGGAVGTPYVNKGTNPFGTRGAGFHDGHSSVDKYFKPPKGLRRGGAVETPYKTAERPPSPTIPVPQGNPNDFLMNENDGSLTSEEIADFIQYVTSFPPSNPAVLPSFNYLVEQLQSQINDVGISADNDEAIRDLMDEIDHLVLENFVGRGRGGVRGNRSYANLQNLTGELQNRIAQLTEEFNDELDLDEIEAITFVIEDELEQMFQAQQEGNIQEANRLATQVVNRLTEAKKELNAIVKQETMNVVSDSDEEQEGAGRMRGGKKNPFKSLQKGMTKVGTAFGKAGEALNPMSYAVEDKGTRDAMVTSGEVTQDYALPAVVSAGKPIYDATAITASTMLTGNPVLGKAVADTLWNEMVAKTGSDPRENQKSAELGELSETFGKAAAKPYSASLGGMGRDRANRFRLKAGMEAGKRDIRHDIEDKRRKKEKRAEKEAMLAQPPIPQPVSVPQEEIDDIFRGYGRRKKGGSSHQTARERADEISPILSNHLNEQQRRIQTQVELGLYDDAQVAAANSLMSHFHQSLGRFHNSNSTAEQDRMMNEMDSASRGLQNLSNEAVSRYQMYRNDERMEEHRQARRRMRGMIRRGEPVKGKSFVPPEVKPKRGGKRLDANTYIEESKAELLGEYNSLRGRLNNLLQSDTLSDELEEKIMDILDEGIDEEINLINPENPEPSINVIRQKLMKMEKLLKRTSGGKRIDFEDIKWGSFTRMFKEFKKENPKARVKDLEAFANRIIKNKNKFSDKAFKKAQFYLNIVKK